MIKYIQDEFVNRCSCRWQKDRFSGGSFFMTEDPEKIKKIENSPFFRNGTIKKAGATPQEGFAEVEVMEEEKPEDKTGSVVLDPDAIDSAMAAIKATESEVEVVETIEQKNQAQTMQPRQTPRAVEWKELQRLSKEQGIPIAGKGITRKYLTSALEQHQIYVQ